MEQPDITARDATESRVWETIFEDIIEFTVPPATMDDDLYDEFGNFIGEEVEASEEESEHGVDVGNYAYDDYSEAAPEAVEEHMDVDGRR